MFYRKSIIKKIKSIYASIRPARNNTISIKHQNILKDVEEEQKTHQKEMNQLKKMEKFRKEYIGNVSHELKTPIFNIQGYLESLATMDKDSKQFKSFLKKALENADRLNTIVQDLDMISKSESEILKLNIESFSIKNLLLEVYEQVEIQRKKINVSLLFKNEKCADYKVDADRERIHQVLTNLISNAIKYNKKDGKVIISYYDMTDYILIEIADTGIGIKQKYLHRLFERFYRVDKDRSRKRGGSGLGLAIVKHILEAHGQAIHVRSTLGAGTTFGFTLKKHIS